MSGKTDQKSFNEYMAMLNERAEAADLKRKAGNLIEFELVYTPDAKNEGDISGPGAKRLKLTIPEPINPASQKGEPMTAKDFLARMRNSLSKAVRDGAMSSEEQLKLKLDKNVETFINALYSKNTPVSAAIRESVEMILDHREDGVYLTMAPGGWERIK